MDERADVDVGQVFRGSDQQASDDGARNGGKAADDEHPAHGLENHQRQRKLYALTRAPKKAGDERDEPGHTPNDAPDIRQTDPDRLRGERVIGDGAQRYATMRVLLNKVARTATITIEIVDAKMSNALICRPKRSERRVVDAQVELVHVRTEKRLRQPLDNEAEAQGRHEQRVRTSVDQSGRNTNRSMSTAPMIMTRTVIGNATQNGSPCSFNTTNVSAAKKTRNRHPGRS